MRQEQDAQGQGCVYLGPASDGRYRTYRLECGHEQEIKTSHVQSGGFRCQACLEKKLESEAEARACLILGEGRNANYRTYRLDCGHEQEVTLSEMRKGNFRCRACFLTELEENAKAWGCKMIGPSKRLGYRIYRLACGHEQEVHTTCMRSGYFRCRTCEEYYYTLPSQVYLLHIEVSGMEWLKLGFSKNVDYRASRYGLPSDAVVTVLLVRQFETGFEALTHEQAIHKKYSRKRISPKMMSDFHVLGGMTECYPTRLVEVLTAEIKSDL